MLRRAPRSLLVITALIAVTSLTLGLYLEWRQLAWLQKHPIMTNLLSGVVGFATATLVVTVLFNWLHDLDRARRLHDPVAREWKQAAATARATFDLMITPEILFYFNSRGLSTDEINPRQPKALTPGSNATHAIGIWRMSPPDPDQWRTATAEMRVAALALLNATAGFAERHHFDSPDLHSLVETTRSLIEALPVDGDANSDPTPFFHARHELIHFSRRLRDLHYRHVRARLRAERDEMP